MVAAGLILPAGAALRVDDRRYPDRIRPSPSSFGVVRRAAATLERSEAAWRPSSRSGEIDAKHEQLISAFVEAARSGDLHALTELLASDVRLVTDGGGKVAAALNVLEGSDRAARWATPAEVGATASRYA